MYDIFTHALFQPKSPADFKVQYMILFPPAWAACALSVSLSWQVVPFDAARVKDVPDNQRGIYSFVVQPGIANHPACSYLLYVGQTARNFRVRYEEYLRDEAAGIEGRRPHISGMLCKWKGYLWFCYAHIEDESLIETTEDALLAAFLPPTNIEMPGKLNQKMAFLLGT
jgi:hypothetical protein